MTELPPPLVPKVVELQNFQDMSLEVARLRDSDFRRLSTGDEFKAGVVLWCAAWHQKPAGSLPDDDTELADLAAIGTGKPAVRAWQRLRAMALRGWVKCSDGRLYHPRLAQKAVGAWKAKQARIEASWKGRLASLAKAIAAEKDPNRKAHLQTDHDQLLREMQQALSLPPTAPPSRGSERGAVQGVLEDLSRGPIEGKGREGIRLEQESSTSPPSPDVSSREVAAATSEDQPQGERPADPRLAVAWSLGAWLVYRGKDMTAEWLTAIDGQDVDQIREVMAWGRQQTDMAVHFAGPTGYEGHRKSLAEARRAKTREAKETERRKADAEHDAQRSEEAEKSQATLRAQVGAILEVYREDSNGWCARMSSDAAIAIGKLRVAYDKNHTLFLLAMTTLKHLPAELIEQAKSRQTVGA